MHQIDLVLGVEAVGTKRYPFFGRVTCQVILREIRSIVRRVRFRIEHRYAAVESEPTQHLGGCTAGCTGANDDDVLRRASGRRLNVRSMLLRPRARYAAFRLV